MSNKMIARARRLTLCIVAIVSAFALLPSASALAAAGISTDTQFDDPILQVGQTNRGGFLRIINGNSAPDTSATICRGGGDDGAALPRCAASEGILLTPSCAAVDGASFCRSSADFPPGADPDVFRVNPVATGMAGTACAGIVFSVTRLNDQFGKYRFVPTGIRNIVLPAFGSQCVIRFTFDVLKSPTRDFDPGVPGLQTLQISAASEQSNLGNPAFAQGASRGVTVIRAAPSITTTASPNITLGAGTLSDSATVSGRVSPVAGATINFRLFGPDDATCTGTPVFTSVVPYPVAGGPVASGSFTPTLAGTYRFVATFSGDANNAPVAGACNAANENVVVNRANPTIATMASPDITVGAGTLRDTATVSGRVNPQAGATVNFRLFGPDDATCTGTPV
ncbi:MAG: Ig-like domain-containing protein, partial [Solirubrobacteraceae bacterium]